MTLKNDIEIVAESPPQAVAYCMYDYGDAMSGNYLNCENQFFDEDENRWVDMSLVDNYFHSYRSIADIANINRLRDSLSNIATYSKNCEENVVISDIIHEEWCKHT